MLHNQYVIYCMQNKQKKKEEEVKEEVLVSVFEGLDLCLYCPKSTDVDTADNILHITAERGHSKLTQKILDRDNNKRLLWVKNCSRQYPVEVALSTKHEDGSKGKTQHYTTAAVLLRAMNSWYLVIVSCFQNYYSAQLFLFAGNSVPALVKRSIAHRLAMGLLLIFMTCYSLLLESSLDKGITFIFY